jgi:hypothetical protein
MLGLSMLSHKDNLFDLIANMPTCCTQEERQEVENRIGGLP